MRALFAGLAALALLAAGVLQAQAETRPPLGLDTPGAPYAGMVYFGLRNPVSSGSAYIPGAVHITNSYQPGTTSALTGVSDGSLGRVSFWLRAAPDNATLSNGATTMLNGDFLSNQSATAGSETVPGFDLSFDNSSGNYGTLRVNLNDATGGSGHQCNYLVPALLVGGNWHYYLIEWNVSGATSSKFITVYVDGVKQGSGGCTYSPGTAMQIHYSNSSGWNLSKPLGGDPTMQFEVSEVFIDFTSSAVDSSNNLSAGEIAKFMSAGAPVDITSMCSTATICLRGGKSTWAATGTAASGLTMTGTVYDASIAPDASTTHKAYERWSINAMGIGGTSANTNAGGNTINTGDLLIATLGLVDSTTGTGDHNPQCPSGWQQLYKAWNNGSVNDPTDVLACAKVAGASETGIYQFTWTTSPVRASGWTLTEYANVNTSAGSLGLGIDGYGGLISGISGTTTTLACPSVTNTYANDTLYCYSLWYTNNTITHTANQNELAYGGSTQSQEATADEYLSASGATGVRNQTIGGGTSGQAVAIAIIPN